MQIWKNRRDVAKMRLLDCWETTLIANIDQLGLQLFEGVVDMSIEWERVHQWDTQYVPYIDSMGARDGCRGWVPGMGAGDGCQGWVPGMRDAFMKWKMKKHSRAENIFESEMFPCRRMCCAIKDMKTRLCIQALIKHHNIFWRSSFLPRYDLNIWSPVTYPEYCQFRLQTKQFHLVLDFLYKSHPSYLLTSLLSHIYTGRQSSYIPDVQTNSICHAHHLSHTLNAQPTAQLLTLLSIHFHGLHHHNMLCPLQIDDFHLSLPPMFQSHISTHCEHKLCGI